MNLPNWEDFFYENFKQYLTFIFLLFAFENILFNLVLVYLNLFIMKYYLLCFILSVLPLFGFGQILEEGFDDITTLSGWTITNQSTSIGATDWFQGNVTVFTSQSGADDSYIGANFNSTTGNSTISTWLITPEVNVKDGDVLSFYTRTTDFLGTVYNDRLEVRMSTGTMTVPSGGPTAVGSFTTVMGIIND